MNVKHLPLQLSLGLALAITGIMTQTPQVQAQSGNQSDITGPIVTTSDIVGGFNFEDDREERLAFASAAIQEAVNNAAVTINQRLLALTLPIVANDPNTATPIPEPIQISLANVVTNSGNVDNSVILLVNDLVEGGADRALAQELVVNLKGLTSGGRVAPSKFQTVTRLYNTLIARSPREFFLKNPNALRAIRSVLAILLNSALASR